MNPEHLATFLAVVRARSFRAAAKERDISQATVSQHIKKLERALHTLLVQRAHGGCEPTAEGARLIPHAESLLRVNARAIASVQRARVVVGASSNISTYMLQPHFKSLVDFASADCTVDIVIQRNPVLAEKLESGEIDVAVMEWWDQRPDCTARLWRTEELVVIVPPDHAWAGLPNIPVSLLKGAPILGGEPGTGTGRLLAHYLGEDADGLKICMRLGSTEAVKQWVKAGLGVSLVLAGTIEREHRDGTLCAIPLEGKPLRKDLYFIWRDSLMPDNLPRRFAERLLADSLPSSSVVRPTHPDSVLRNQV